MNRLEVNISTGEQSVIALSPAEEAIAAPIGLGVFTAAMSDPKK